MKYIPEASSRLQALQTGEVDLIYGADLLSYDDYNQVGADPHAVSLKALKDFQRYANAVNMFSTSADPKIVQEAITTALNISNDNVIDFPISYAKDLVVYNSSKIASYTFSSVPQFFDVNNVKPVE